MSAPTSSTIEDTLGNGSLSCSTTAAFVRTMLGRCQQSRYFHNNGQMCSSSLVASQTSTSDGKPNVDGSSRLSSG